VHWRCHPRCERLIEDIKLVHLDEHGLPDKKNHSLTHASDAEGYRVEYLRPARATRRPTIGGQWGFYAPP